MSNIENLKELRRPERVIVVLSDGEETCGGSPYRGASGA